MVDGFMNRSAIAAFAHPTIGNYILFGAVLLMTLSVVADMYLTWKGSYAGDGKSGGSIRAAVRLLYECSNLFQRILFLAWILFHVSFLIGLSRGVTNAFMGANPALFDCLLLDSIYICIYYWDEFVYGIRVISKMIFVSSIYGIFEYILDGKVPLIMVPSGHRIYAFFENPIPGGCIFIIGFWLALYEMMQHKQKRIIDVAVVIVDFTAVVLSMTRSVWMGFVLGVVLLFGIAMSQIGAKDKKKMMRCMLAALLACGIILLIGAAVLMSNAEMRVVFASRFTNVSESEPYIVRMSRMKYMLLYFLHDAGILGWILGSGYGASCAWVLQYVPVEFQHGYVIMDNQYLTILLEEGLIGIAAVIVFIRHALRGIRPLQQKGYHTIFDCVTMICVSMILPIFFYDIQGWPCIMVLLIPLLSVIIADKSRSVKEDGEWM